jgi:hypothetical protein
MRKRNKKPKIALDGVVTFYQPCPSWLYFNGALYEVDDRVARGLINGDLIVKFKKKK